jgi:phage terminase large subunit-like protein
MEHFLVHGEGDYLGQPFRPREWERAIIYRAYELKPDGTRRYERVLLGLPKGNGKSELAAAIALVELGGPSEFAGWRENGPPIGRSRTSPDIPIAAASFKQADLVFATAATMVRHGPLKLHCEVYDTEILLKGRTGKLYRVAAEAGTNDGARPSFFVADEVHEWEGRKERVHLVLSNGRAKRKGSWQLDISTAGWNAQSLLGKAYTHGLRVRAGDEVDPGFLFIWYEAPKELDLGDPVQFEQAIRAANPAAGDFLPIENLRARYREMPEFEFRRYHLNQWTSAPQRWFPAGVFEARARQDRTVADKALITIGFDGSYAGDSTAVLGCTTDEHLFVIGAWEKPEGQADWRVDILDVEQTVRQACQRWRVTAIGCDPFRWQRSLAVLQAEGLPILEWPSHSASRMAPACTQFYEAVTGNRLTHDGDARLLQHTANAVVRIDSRGPRIVKEYSDSARHIDLTVAAIIAHDLAVRGAHAQKPSVYATRGVRTV